jgi:hypothetical protein
MKNICLLFSSFLLAAAMIPACKKSSSAQHQAAPLLTLSKPAVKKGEQVFATVALPSGAVNVKWDIGLSANALVFPGTGNAKVIFASAGKYQISAKYYSTTGAALPYDSSTAPVTVTDSVFQPDDLMSGWDSVTLTGNVITLIPVAATDSGLVVAAQTADLYDCSAYITAYGWGQGPSSLSFLFSNAEAVQTGGSCNGMKSPAISYIFFTALANGTYSVSVDYAQATYQGSLTVTDHDFTFSWPYSTGVVIAPLSIPRQ